MPNWKKLITSGSNAVLNTVTASAFLATGSSGIQFVGTASQASTASYAIGYPRIIAQGAKDASTTIGTLFPTQPLNFAAPQFALAGTAIYRTKVSSSIASLPPGEYQIYLDFFASLSQPNIPISFWITTNHTFNAAGQSEPNGLDTQRIPGSLITNNWNATSIFSHRCTILTPKFTVGTTSTYYLVGVQTTTYTTTQHSLAFSSFNSARGSNVSIIYRYDT